MTTAAVAQTPAKTDAPGEPSASFADLFYAPESTQADTSEAKQESTPAQAQDTENTSAEQADATPPAKAEEKPVAQADEKKDDKTDEKVDERDTQLKNQIAANRRLGKEKADLEKRLGDLSAKLEEIEAKANGTWQEKPKPSADQVAREADFRGREKAARPLAEKEFGAEAVEAAIYAGKEAPFVVLTDQKPWLLLEVSESAQPPLAAMKILQREKFMEQYGDDPRTWESAIIEAAKPKLFEEFKKQLDKQPVGKEVPTVSTARNSGGQGAPRKEPRIADLIYDGK